MRRIPVVAAVSRSSVCAGLLLSLFAARAAPAQDPPAPMTVMQMVFLRAAVGKPEPEGQKLQEMQAEHLARLARLNRERVNLLYGPFLDGGELRGIVVLDVADAEAARQLVAADPLVAAGLMSVEVRPWYGSKSELHLPEDPPTTENLILGFLMRGPHRSQPAAEAEEIQKGHLAYMAGLHEQGKLALAGPFAEDSDWRGVVIYRVGSVDEARQLAAGDPAVAAGRLVIDARPWLTFKGILR